MAVAALLMTLIVAARYLLVSGSLAWLTHRTGHARAVRAAQVRAEIRWSLLSAAIYGIPAGLTFWAWKHRALTQLYLDPRAHPIWWLPVSIIVYLFLHDSWFYFTHRLMHTPTLFRLVHAVHHRSRPPTAWAAMSFHPYEAISGAILLPALAWIIPIHFGALGIILLIASLMGTTNHMGWEFLPRRLADSGIISAAHHELHHRDYRCNYGLYFRFWDRLLGTDKGIAHDMLRN